MPNSQTTARSIPGAWSIPATKLSVPPLRTRRVIRSRLLARLDGLWQSDRNIAWVVAPAGFGKTTLLSEWATAQSTRCVWLSLDENDDDAARFLHCLLAALARLEPSIGQDLLPTLMASPCPVIPVLGALINEISLKLDRFVVILDDIHTLTQAEIFQALDYFIEHGPSQMRVILASRAELTLPLTRWRSRNRLIELDLNDLRFALPEAAQFFLDVCEIDLPAADLQRIDQQVEGWVAGFQLTALALQNRAIALPDGFERARRFIFDYLASEVLNCQPANLRRFLLETSILDRLSVELCESVTGRDDGRACLTAIEQSNLFVVRLDEQGQWYRYHPLLAELLRTELQQDSPETIATLHCRAAGWYERHAQTEQAIDHYVTAKAFDKAATLVEQLCFAYFQQGKTNTLRRWFEALPRAVIAASPRLCLTRAQLFFQSKGLGEASFWINRAEKLAPFTVPDASLLHCELLMLQAQVLAGTQPGSPAAIDLCEQALALEPVAGEWIQAPAYALYGSLLWQGGQLEAGFHAYHQALTMSRARGDWWTFIRSAAELILLLVARARFAEARRLCYEALELVEAHFLTPDDWPVVAGRLVRSLSYLEYEQDHLAEAMQFAGQAIQVGRQHHDVDLQVAGLTVQIRVTYATGQPEAAVRLARQAFALAQQTGNVAEISNAETYLAWMLIAAGDLAAAEAWATRFQELTGRSEHLAVQDYYPEFETLTLVRLFLAKADIAAAISLLNARLEVAKASGRQRMLIKTLIMRAIALKLQSDDEQAIKDMTQALSLAEPNGFVRLFLDEGEPVRELLIECKARLDRSANRQPNIVNYADSLLTAYQSKLASAVSPVNKPAELSDREYEILQLISHGLSNADIAESLSISLNTVYTHTKHIFRKLGARSRTQAVALARDRGLL